MRLGYPATAALVYLFPRLSQSLAVQIKSDHLGADDRGGRSADVELPNPNLEALVHVALGGCQAWV